MATAPAGSIAQSSTLYISCWYSSHFENDMSDLCSLAEGGGGGGGGGGVPPALVHFPGGKKW